MNEPTEKELSTAKSLKSYMPYRMVFIAKNEHETRYICKPTRHAINSLLRQGYQAWEVK